MKTKKILILMHILCITSLAKAQSSYFSLGPAVAADWRKFNLLNGFQSTVKEPATFSYGFEATYRTHRLLLNAKILTSQRTFYNDRYIDDSISHALVYRVQASGQYFNLPIGLNYKVNNDDRFEIYTGIGLAFEWLPKSLKYMVIDTKGTQAPTNLQIADNQPKFIGGGGLQLVVRYHVNNKFLLQLEPMFTYYPNVSTAYASGSKTQYNVAFSMGYKFR